MLHGSNDSAPDVSRLGQTVCYHLLPVHDLDLSRHIYSRSCMIFNVAHAAGWGAHNVYDPAHASWIRSAQCTDPAQPLTMAGEDVHDAGEELHDLDLDHDLDDDLDHHLDHDLFSEATRVGWHGSHGSIIKNGVRWFIPGNTHQVDKTEQHQPWAPGHLFRTQTIYVRTVYTHQGMRLPLQAAVVWKQRTAQIHVRESRTTRQTRAQEPCHIEPIRRKISRSCRLHTVIMLVNAPRGVVIVDAKKGAPPPRGAYYVPETVFFFSFLRGHLLRNVLVFDENSMPGRLLASLRRDLPAPKHLENEMGI